MATFTDRLKVIVDWDGKSAESSIGRFRDAVRSADTTSGKMKAGFKSMTDSLAMNAAGLAATAGVGLVMFAKNSADAFSDLAKQSIDLGAATGFSTEQASRWIAVGDDFQVSADAIASAVGKITKNLNDPKWAEYGIATRDASGQARDANDIFLDTLDLLARTPNETERARIAAELLGKGWQSIAPMIGKTRAEYEAMLGAVDDNQLITADEARKAEKYRLAMDHLNDALQGVALSLGEVAVSAGPTIDKLAQVVELANKAGMMVPSALNDMGDAAGVVTDQMSELGRAAIESGDRMGYLRDQGYSTEQALNILNYTLGGVESATKAVTSAHEEYLASIVKKDIPRLTDDLRAAQHAMEDVESATIEAEKAMLDFPERGPAVKAMERIRNAAGDTVDYVKELQDLLGDLDEEEAILNLEDQFRELKDANDEYLYAVVSGADDVEEAESRKQHAIIETKREIEQVASTILKLPPKVTTELIAMVDKGQAAQAEAALKVLSYPRDVHMKPIVTAADAAAFIQQISSLAKGVSKFSGLQGLADGGTVKSGVPYIVGEEGPELFVPNGSGKIIPNDQLSSTSGGIGGNVTFNVYTQATNGEELARELKEYMRRNGGRL